MLVHYAHVDIDAVVLLVHGIGLMPIAVALALAFLGLECTGLVTLAETVQLIESSARKSRST